MTKFVIILLGVFALSGCQKQPSTGEAAVFTADFLSDTARVELQLPAKGEVTVATDADCEKASTLDPEVSNAVGAFLKPKAIEWRIVAARPIGKNILLWIAFPKIADGGVDLIYSVEKKKIVGEFLGGYRG